MNGLIILLRIYKHVHIFPPEYNVTELHGESVCLNYINKVKYKNVVIWHFSEDKRGNLD